jgi:hypothetical protein
VIFPYYNDIRRDRVPYRTNSLDNCNLFPIARLYLLYLCPTIRACYDHSYRNNTHYKAGLVEVVDIRLINRVFRDYVFYKLKPAPNHLWIFVFGPLVIIFPLKTRPKLWSSSYKIPSPARSDAFAITRRDNSIYYIFHNTESRRKSFSS